MAGLKKQDLRANTYQQVCSYSEVDTSKILKTHSFDIITNHFVNDDAENKTNTNYVCLGFLKSTHLENPYLWKYWIDAVTKEFYYNRVYYYACFLDVSKKHLCLSDGLVFVPVYKSENDYVQKNVSIKSSCFFPVIHATKDCIGGFYSDYDKFFDGSFIDRAKLMLQIFEQYDIEYASAFEKKVLKNAYDNTFLMLYDNTFSNKKHSFDNPVSDLMDHYRHNQRQKTSLSNYIEICEKKATIVLPGVKKQASQKNDTTDDIFEKIRKNKEKKKQEKKDQEISRNFKL